MTHLRVATPDGLAMVRLEDVGAVTAQEGLLTIRAHNGTVLFEARYPSGEHAAVVEEAEKIGSFL